ATAGGGHQPVTVERARSRSSQSRAPAKTGRRRPHDRSGTMARAPDRFSEDPMTSTEPPRRLHPAFRALPTWPGKTVAVLATVAPSPHLIPVSAPVRGGDTRILISLRRDRGSLARLRARPAVALLVLAEGDIAFTVHGTAHILEEPMKVAEAYTAVEIDIDTIDDHRQ